MARPQPEYSERIARLMMKDGTAVELHREDGDVLACHQDRCLLLPGATAELAIALVDLIQSMGGTLVEEEDRDE